MKASFLPFELSIEWVRNCEGWFERYVDSFRDGVTDQKGIELKAEHSLLVRDLALDIAGTLNLDPGGVRLAGIVGLLHDAGRFEQIRRYGTFVDLLSENHALLGARILREKGILDALGERERTVILDAIGGHNKAVLTESLTPESLFFTNLTRDADKLDILRVVLGNGGVDGDVVDLGLPNLPEVSDEVVQDLLDCRMVHHAKLRTVNDFRLLQMAWVFDLNFDRTVALWDRAGYLETIRDFLPKTDGATAAYQATRRELDRRLGNQNEATSAQTDLPQRLKDSK
jgi:hypothetical protein